MAFRNFALGFLAVIAFSDFVFASGGSTSIALCKKNAHADVGLARRSRTNEPEAEGNSKYWYGNFTVGDGKDVQLLIDTGSGDILLDPGVYKPSPKSKPYEHPDFNITYEGVNKAGGGFEFIAGKVFRDVVSAAGLAIPNQPIGNITRYHTVDARPKPHALSRDGIIGFLGSNSSVFDPPGTSWFYNVCRLKLIPQCRFGVAFGTNDKGRQVLGSLDKDLYKGELTVAPLQETVFSAWTAQADVLLNGKVLFPNQTMIMDTGTNDVQSPVDQARQIFEMLGFQYTVRHGGANPIFPMENVTTITGYFPCDKPPTLSFRFPAAAVLADPPASPTISKNSSIFSILPSEWAFERLGNNNCTAVLYGTNALRIPPLHIDPWLLGQAFYQGHYVDHNREEGTLGYADLKDPAMVG